MPSRLAPPPRQDTVDDTTPLLRPTRLRGALPAVLAALLAAATLAGMVTLWPTGEFGADLTALGVATDAYQAEVAGVTTEPCFGTTPEEGIPCRRVTFLITQGPDRGRPFAQDFPIDLASTPEFTVGEKVVLYPIEGAAPGFEYQYADRQRRPTLIWVALAFAVAVVALGRMRGLAALAGLGASLVVLLVFVLPAILEGRTPVLVAVVGAAAIAYLALYLAHGFSPKTTVALLGTLGSLALTAGLSALVIAAARLSGFATEESLYLTLVPGQINVRGLLLAGVVLGALGALDDVTVTQASAVWEVRRANPGLGVPQLMRAGLRVGRDHIASTVNTLVLAYAGASMPLLILFVLSRQSLGSIANSEVVATEIVRTLVGSIGLVAAVPITTWLAAQIAVTQPGGDRPDAAEQPPYSEAGP